MGEIKSTMEIVMEKTRHLTLSEEEKGAQKKEEMRKSLRGLIVKFRDGVLTMERLAEEQERLEKSHGVSTEGLLEMEIFDQIDLNGENSALLSLLRGVCKADTEPLETILNGYKDALSAAWDRHASESKDRIYRKWKIAGSAVSPNMENQAALTEEVQAIRDAYRQRIAREFEKKRGR